MNPEELKNLQAPLKQKYREDALDFRDFRCFEESTRWLQIYSITFLYSCRYQR